VWAEYCKEDLKLDEIRLKESLAEQQQERRTQLMGNQAWQDSRKAVYEGLKRQTEVR
jgi:hypothetical protein